MRKSTRFILAVWLAAIFAGPPLSAMAQQPATGGAAAGATGSATTVAVNPAEAELKATIYTFQSDIQVARHQYYWWRGNCYFRYPSGSFAQVIPSYCS
jgi:hypothetical protein